MKKTTMTKCDLSCFQKLEQKKIKTSICDRHPSFGSWGNEKKTMTTSPMFVVVVLDVATQEKKPRRWAWFQKYLHRKKPRQWATTHHPSWIAYTMQQKPRWQAATSHHGFKGCNKKNKPCGHCLGFKSN
jgi:hypothetical protein